MNRLLIILTILSLTLHAGLPAPPDGLMTLYHDNGSKKIEKAYKGGQPSGTWTRWYENGEIWGVIKFEITTLSSYEERASIVKIDLRYPDKDNTIKFKGEAFPKHLIDIQNDDGSSLVMPVWDYISNSYGENGEPLEESDFAVELKDDTTGMVFHFPWPGVEMDQYNNVIKKP